MLTKSELDAIRLESIKGSEEYLYLLRGQFSPWIGRLIRTEADARLLLEPIDPKLGDDELIDFKDGTKSTRLDRIDFLLQYWDDPSKIDLLVEAVDLLEYLIEVTIADQSWEWYQPARDILDALGNAVCQRIQEHRDAIPTLPISDQPRESISPSNGESAGRSC